MNRTEASLRLPTLTAIVMTTALSLAACERYERRPLDLAAHHAAWAARDAGGADLAAFAAQLAGRDAAARAEFNPADGLSLAEAEITTLFFNPELRTARLRAQVTAATAEHAGLWDDPVVALDVLRIVESVPDPWIVGASLGFTIPLSGRLQAEQALAAAEHRAELARVAQREWQVITELRRAWIEWSAVRLRAEVIEQVGQSIQEAITAVDKLEQVGELPPIQARLFRIDAATLAAEAATLRGRSIEMELVIKSLLGLLPDAPIQLQPTVALETALPAFETRAEASEAQQLERHPDLAVLRSEYAAAEETLHREIRKQYPDLGIGPAYENEGDQSRIGFIASLPIPLLNRNRQGIAVARAQREVARAAYETEYERVVHELAQARAQRECRRNVREQLEQTLVPLVQEQARDAQRLAELGEFDAVIHLESLQRLAEAKTRLIEAREAEALAAAAVQALLGPPAPAQSQTQPDSPNSTQGANP